MNTIFNFKDEVEYVKIDFERKSKRAASCKGKLIMLADKTTKHIIDYRFNVIECNIDLFTTPSWFGEKSQQKKSRILREELFKNLGLSNKHEKRPSTSSNRIIKLNNKQIMILNEFINNVEKCTTIKNFIRLISGCNPAGEGSTPSRAPLKAVFNGTTVPFSLLIKALYVGHKYKPFNKLWLNDVLGQRYQVKTFKQFINSSEELNKYFTFLTKVKTNFNDYKIFRKEMKKKLDNYRKQTLPIYYENVARERANYSKTIDEYYRPIIRILNSFHYDRREDWEKAHIFGVSEIKNEILKEAWENTNVRTKEYINYISNKFNFLPLENSIHKMYDKYQIIYNMKGSLIPLKITGEEFGQIYKKLENIIYTNCLMTD